MSDGPRSRRPVEIKEGDDTDAEGGGETSRPLRPARSSRPPRVDSAAPPSRRSRTPKPPGVTPKPPGVTPKPPGVTPRPPTASSRPSAPTPRPPSVKPAAKSKAKPSRSRKKAEPRNRLDSHAEGFFAEGETVSQTPEYEDEAGLPSSIFSVARRQTLMRYVYVALAVSTLLCGIAIARAFMTPSAPAHEAVAATPSASALAAPAVSLTFPVPSASASAAAIPSATPSAALPVASAAPVVADAAPEAPTKSASEEKGDAQRALNRGKLKDAAEAATRSTTLDPTDADAWLLLGAADMEMGKAGDARAAFAACAKQATKGQIGECRSMLR